ncbi:MAG: NosR/NirI family protein [Zoogloeaceae bacterium]|nr:NosR/NirI family protein [Zoogloeaceae bacterium]
MIARLFCSLLLALGLAGEARAADLPAVYPQARGIFPAADAYGGFEGMPPSAAVYKDGKPIGYLFLTDDVLRIPAYSGKPINTMVGLDLDGHIAGLAIVNHDEPILAVGITPERLGQYVAQYEGKSVFDKVIVGAGRPGHVAIDGITGATITVMVENATVMRSARQVAEARGMRDPGIAAPREPAAAAPVPAQAQTQAPVQSSLAPASAEVTPPLAVVSTQAAQAVAAAALAPVSDTAPPAAQQAAVQPLTAPPSSAPAVKTPLAPVLTPVYGAVPLSSEFPPPTIAPLPAKRGTWIPPQEEPVWIPVWQSRAVSIGVLVAGLVLLFTLLIFQDWLACRPNVLNRIRLGFQIYTLCFIGWYGLAQLSVVNVLTFTHSVMGGFRWEYFLIDPMLFILWGFVAITLLLWGRGVYCGWLCPFGALQDLILTAARKLKLPEIEFSDAVHERLVALKYILLILLFGVSLQSIAEAAWYAEVEPFKTAITLHFQREWPYVLYALILIGLAAVNRKFYCKYLCPLGAALAIPGRFRLFEWWLRRRKECGKPCQVCSNRCSVRAIRPTGEINANECHYCLDCQVIYHDERVCLPLIDRRKRHERGGKAAENGAPAAAADPAKS